MGLLESMHGTAKAEKAYEEKLSELDEEQQAYVDNLVHRAWDGEELDRAEVERLEEADAMEAFQAGLAYAYVSLMREGTEGLFHGDIYAPDMDEAQELWETRAGQYQWLSKKREDVPLPDIPADDYEAAREKYREAERAFHKARNVETYLTEDVKATAKTYLEREYALIPEREEEEELPSRPVSEPPSPLDVVVGLSKAYTFLKTLAHGEHYRPAATEDPGQKEQEATERRERMEDEMEAMREELESLHGEE